MQSKQTYSILPRETSVRLLSEMYTCQSVLHALGLLEDNVTWLDWRHTLVEASAKLSLIQLWFSDRHNLLAKQGIKRPCTPHTAYIGFTLQVLV